MRRRPPTDDDEEVRGLLVVLVALFPAVLLVACFLTFCQTRDVVEHRAVAHWYRQCVEDYGYAASLATLEKNGRSVCAERIETELGITNRWPTEFK